MTYMRLLLPIACALLLQACAYSLDLHPRDGTPAGTGTATSADKHVEITIGGQVYKGTYTYDGGQAFFGQSFGTATAYGRGGFANAFGNVTTTGYVPGSGNGGLVAFGPGNTIRCEFTFRSGSGIGVCQDNAGKAYDLVIAGPGG